LLLAHAAAVWLTSALTAPDRSNDHPRASVLVASIIDTLPEGMPLAVLQPRLVPPQIDITLPEPVWPDEEESDAASTTPIMIHFRAPQVDVQVFVDKKPFAAKAGLNSGKTALVVLALDITADGRVATVLVQKSAGNPNVDAAAVAYARSLRWTPGILKDRPSAMRVRFPVMLTGNM
jgi:TonB family protein